jgi:pimeloyl-ACP methyl ester carboxylesterase
MMKSAAMELGRHGITVNCLVPGLIDTPLTRHEEQHQEWFYAYLGVGQMVNMQKSEKIGYDFALEQAREQHNSEAEKELLAIAPYPGEASSLTIPRISTQRKWVMYYGGLTYGRTSFSYDGNAWKLSPDYTEEELDGVDDGSLLSLTHLLGPMHAVNFDAVTKFKCPVFLFIGRHDYTTSHELAEEWFKKIKAPKKEFVWFDNSSHMVMQEEPGRFLYYLVKDLRPLAVAAGDSAPENELLR